VIVVVMVVVMLDHDHLAVVVMTVHVPIVVDDNDGVSLRWRGIGNDEPKRGEDSNRKDEFSHNDLLGVFRRNYNSPPDKPFQAEF
jgi:hypothetical protein